MVGDLTRALPLFKENLKTRERVLGRDNPYTLGSRNNLAHAYKVAGNQSRAISLYEQTLADGESALGNDHTFIRAARESLERLQR